MRRVLRGSFKPGGVGLWDVHTRISRAKCGFQVCLDRGSLTGFVANADLSGEIRSSEGRLEAVTPPFVPSC